MKKSNSEQPYERFLTFGPENLTDAELLAIIIRTGTKDADALTLARKIFEMTKIPKKGLLGLYDFSIQELMQIKGIGEVKAIKIKCLAELAMRINVLKAKESVCFNNTGSVAAYLMEALRHRKNEGVYLLSLDTKGKLLAQTKLSEGCVNLSLISPRDIFIKALKDEAVNIIIAHNHPSGDPTPSEKDITITNNIYEMSIKLGIPLLDHIIIGDNVYSSFKELNLI